MAAAIPVMNGATLKTIREALGLPVPWFADYVSVQERTVRYWEAERNAVPADVANAILVLEQGAAEMVESIVGQVRALIAESGPLSSPLPIVRYVDGADLARYQPNMAGLPATYHAAAIARARWVLAGEVEIEARMLDAGAYEAWRRSTLQADSPQLRAQFAALD